jgi:hypothetical protein
LDATRFHVVSLAPREVLAAASSDVEGVVEAQ